MILQKKSNIFSIISLMLLVTVCLVRGSGALHLASGVYQSPFVAYTDTIPGSEISFQMVPIPGGEFLMGSPEGEIGRNEDEGPVRKIRLSPFWMGKFEITWDEFDLFVYPEMNRALLDGSSKTVELDGISQPTPPFVDMSFGMGKKGFPAINMTQYAALSYCKWLTEITGDFYRLPTEAEWEYACRAGIQSAYSFGDSMDKLQDYAWFYENSEDGYKKVGTKKPNAWGLHDMHGNVSEWTLDGYLSKYPSEEGGTLMDPWVEPKGLYPHAVRGGSWDDDPEDLRSSVRLASNSNWKQRDPQIPKSAWWMTDAAFLGFRVVRPLERPSPEKISQYFKDAIPDL